MVRDVDPIDSNVVIGQNSPPVESTVEALIRAHNRMPKDTDLGVGDLLQWDGTQLVKVDLSGAAEGDLLTVQADGTVAPAAGTSATATPTPPAPRFIRPPFTQSSSFAFTNGSVRACPIDVDRAITVDQIVCDVTSAGSAGSVVRMGIYADDGSNQPGALVIDGGTVDGTTMAVKLLTIAATALAPGRYWLVAVNQGAPTTTASLRFAERMVAGSYHVTQSAILTGAAWVSVSMTGVTGALPGAFVPASRDQNPPVLAMRIA